MPALDPDVIISQLNTLMFKPQGLKGLLSLPCSLPLRGFTGVFCGPAAPVLHRAGLRCGQVPVYDARRVLAGTAVVEILASSIKVAPAR